jgi:hypothetical protein
MEALGKQLRFFAMVLLMILGTMVVDFMALDDIAADYVSKEVLNSFEVAASLPGWTATELEWQWLGAMFVLRLLLVFIAGFLLLRISKRIKILKPIL